jgi:hypothetical protein
MDLRIVHMRRPVTRSILLMADNQILRVDDAAGVLFFDALVLGSYRSAFGDFPATDPVQGGSC